MMNKEQIRITDCERMPEILVNYRGHFRLPNNHVSFQCYFT